jgi:predicted helicase
MAAKARLLAGIIEKALNKDIENGEETELNNQYEGFKSILIDTISTKDFSDLYAQTIAYGMFAARINYDGTEDFTREKAAKSIPQTNPFLRKMFGFIAGVDLDSRISWVVDALADLFNYVDIDKIHAEIGRYADNDPIIHFYETFLTAYDKKLKKQRGVWYTPQPVVRFMVRAVDEILKTDFGISAGLADSSKVTVGGSEYHKVQILDPATGTGTFLAEVVEQIHKHFENQQGIWSSYVNEHLIPRLNGFEILMASYAMAHLKLEMLLQETGVRANNHSPQRLRIYLTDSLDEENSKDKAKQTKTSILKWLADEANEAAHIKRDSPVMVILGNPPYSGESINKGKWILNLLDDYKKEPTGGRLQEKNSKWLNDDYVKFIRLGQHFVEKNGCGILAYINNHSFLDNPTFRGMRWHLLQTFDTIYILDLHGNAKKKETAPDDGKDENVFDIRQGVSINIFVKTGRKNRGNPANVFHYDLYGKRAEKYNFLLNANQQTIKWKKLKLSAPQYFFTVKDLVLQKEYEKGFSVKELFPVNGTGIITKRDNLCVHLSVQQAFRAASDVVQLEKGDFYSKYSLPKDVRDWKYEWAKNDVKSGGLQPNLVRPICYRPFDVRSIYYTGRSRGLVGWPVYQIMQHFLKGENVGLITIRRSRDNSLDWKHIFCCKNIISGATAISSLDINYLFPLYLYQENFGQTERVTNMNEAIVKEFAARIGAEKVNELQLFDYIYAVLHSPAYREKYREFLKIDFPRIPYPDDAEQLIRLVGFGERLRKLHLMENVEATLAVAQNVANFPVAGTNEIENSFTEKSNDYRDNKVFINSTQYFDNVPQAAWEFYIGGYQPAQKWLKDRKGRKLDYDDVRHYQKMIAVLCETERVMMEIDSAVPSPNIPFME